MADPSFFCSPLSIILAVLLLLLTAFAWRYGNARRWIGPTAVVVLALVSIIMALDGTLGLGLQHHWAFIAVAVALIIASGVASFEAFGTSHSLSFRLSHLGFFFIVFGALWSGADFREMTMTLSQDETSYLGLNSKGEVSPLPFRVTLREFRTDYYPDGVSPKQYTSFLDIDGEKVETSVNHPAYRRGWMIYQSGFDKSRPGTTVLLFVRDHWLVLIFIGMLLMAVGAVTSTIKSWRSKWTLPVMLALAVLFGAISVARINFGTLMPALRSLWFIPHIIIYMLAYALLAVASVLAIWSLVKPGKVEEIRDRLLQASSSLLLVGMICGAVWAKMAWGDWWSWDPKENWAAVTWMITLMGTHWNAKWGSKAVPVFIILAFLGMQMTWYGVDYLPSASHSLHAYK